MPREACLCIPCWCSTPEVQNQSASKHGQSKAPYSVVVLVLAAATFLLSSTAGSPPPICTCTKQLSKSPCVDGKTFGCLHDGTMWAVGCRGVFTCNGIKGVDCSVDTPDPTRNHTCKCQPPPSPTPPPAPKPEPPQPVISAGFFTANIFWPFEEAEDGMVFACIYLPTLVTANHTRLIAHGSCATEVRYCDGLHVDAPRVRWSGIAGGRG